MFVGSFHRKGLVRSAFVEGLGGGNGRLEGKKTASNRDVCASDVRPDRTPKTVGETAMDYFIPKLGQTAIGGAR